MMKIIADENIPYVSTVFSTLGQVTTLAGRSISNADLKNAQILLLRSVTQVNQALLQDTPIKFVATATSGINHIDVECLQSKDIAFAHALGSNANSVAQYVASAVCCWSVLQKRPLSQLTMGIIGYGNVGKKVKEMCDKIGITCILNDPPLAALDNAMDFKNIDEALDCDIISLHVPLVATGKYPTQHLIDTKQIGQLKNNTLIINAARGGVVNEAALLSRKLAKNDISIVLDVWENEPCINMEMLAQTLIATPHIAGYSFDGKIKGTQMIYQACCEFLKVLPKWSIDEVRCSEQPQRVDLQNSCSSILTAYNILDDDQRLRKITSIQQNHQDAYFDGLRKNYPIRREWL